MRFNPKARIDQSQIETRSGGGLGGGGMRLPMPGGGGGRIGLGTVVIVILFVVLTQCMGVDVLGGSDGGGSDSPAANSCQTGADANKSQDCAVDLFTNSVQNFWKQEYPQQTDGRPYSTVKTIRFQGSTDSGCGPASASMGPFYCPNDKNVYLDTTFFDDMLRGELGAEGGPFAIGYVIAHEYGHHVEDELGILGQIRTQRGPDSDAVRVELMADCLAGVWAKYAQQTTDAQGNAIIADLTQDDIRQAIDAAQAVGDDRIQKRTSGRVDTDSFTHGSAEQRVSWFNRGLKLGTIQDCDTFNTGDL